MSAFAVIPLDDPWPLEEPGCEPAEMDDEAPLELDDETWDALLPDDDYESHPEYGDFWTDGDDEGCSAVGEDGARPCATGSPGTAPRAA